jgi:hypothetical protein
MNAPANIRTRSLIRVDENQIEAAHRQAISVHCPNCGEIEMAARVDLATLRDQATIGIARATNSAGALLSEVARLATSAVYAPVPASRLIRIKSALDLTMMAARALERAQRNG